MSLFVDFIGTMVVFGLYSLAKGFFKTRLRRLDSFWDLGHSNYTFYKAVKRARQRWRVANYFSKSVDVEIDKRPLVAVILITVVLTVETWLIFTVIT
jgi:hypothetical protein